MTKPYDSILKIATYSFVNALVRGTDLADDDYEVIASDIFRPGSDVKSMDILLKGKKGYVNIEFHKQPLSKSHLTRDFKYVMDAYFFYEEIIDQRIIVVDNDRKSVDRLHVMPNWDYVAKYHILPDIDGATVLNTIKNKVENNLELDEDEKYVFSILPLTNHGYDNEDQLIKELCQLTPRLNICEKDRGKIWLCQLILVDLIVDDEDLADDLMETITMSYSRLERREKRLIKEAVEKAEQERDEAKDAVKKTEQERDEAKDAVKKAELEKKEMNDILEEAKSKMDGEGRVTLNKDTFEKLLSITAKI
ncbi:hypothetical protein [Methanobrevibacter millerae]|uniref:PD-(D/E)XK nuclease family transposase n=1 Tax=Methanobrevibacter millerae TaxID=230361 RepID=A0A1G5UTT8_9EURY|nr:hypothetical protein [Methanobrevibacter millerae]SDA37030.1 hypothetical protein SAMN02910315_00020 [Methanobrevibacter millerae]